LTEIRKRNGPILSARNAAVFLEFFRENKIDLKHISVLSGIENRQKVSSTESLISQRLCEWEHASSGFLFPSGMSAIFAVLNLLRKKEKPQVIVIGLLYSESYTLLMDSGLSSNWEAIFLGLAELERLPEILSDKTAMIITETITNPLGEVPDLEKIGNIANSFGVPFVVDSTLALRQIASRWTTVWIM